MDEHTEQECVICGCKFTGWGNNPEPFPGMSEGRRACDECNDRWVVPIRMIQGRRDTNKRLMQFCVDIARHAAFMVNTRKFVSAAKKKRAQQLKRTG